MKEITTEIIINAPPRTVWTILTNFSEYPEWNPFITSLEGTVSEGNRIKITLSPPDSNTMVFKPVIEVFEENKKLQWLGRLSLPGLFDGRHTFEIIDTGNNTSIFIQREAFRGLLVPLLAKSLDNNTKRGFILMNEKLKQKCESR